MTETTKMTASEAVDFLNVWGEAELKKVTSQTTKVATSAAKAAWDADRALLAQENPDWVMPAWSRAPAWRRWPYMLEALTMPLSPTPKRRR